MARIQGVDTAAGRAGGILGQSDELAGRVFRFEFGRGSPPWPSVCIPVVLVGKGRATDVQNEADGRTSRFWAFRAKCRTHSRGGKKTMRWCRRMWESGRAVAERKATLQCGAGAGNAGAVFWDREVPLRTGPSPAAGGLSALVAMGRAAYAGDSGVAGTDGQEGITREFR